MENKKITCKLCKKTGEAELFRASKRVNGKCYYTYCKDCMRKYQNEYAKKKRKQTGSEKPGKTPKKYEFNENGIKKIMTVKEMSEYLKLSKTTILNIIKKRFKRKHKNISIKLI